MGIGKEDQNSNRQYTHNKEAEQSLAESNEESTAVLAPETRNQSRVSKQEKESHSPLLITVICIPLLLISSFVFGDELAKAFVFVRAHAASLRHVNPQAQSTRIEYIETPYLIYRNAGMEALAARKKRQSKYFFEQALIESEKENGPVSLAKAAELDKNHGVSFPEFIELLAHIADAARSREKWAPLYPTTEDMLEGMFVTWGVCDEKKMNAVKKVRQRKENSVFRYC